ncbi:MAG: hypothetical protein H0V17_06335 [Deltaproteobacteria bacterium]|nr:hypothetical protein [Deltaproteobacteria bacterium]
MLGTLFLGDDDTTNESERTEPSVDAKSCDPVKLDTLGELLGVDDPAGDPLDPTAEEHWILPLSAPFIAALAKIDATQRPDIAKQWAATEEWQADGGTAASLDRMLGEIAKLAKQAVSEDKPIFLWLSL